jgi:hypothetical protein
MKNSYPNNKKGNEIPDLFMNIGEAGRLQL